MECHCLLHAYSYIRKCDVRHERTMLNYQLMIEAYTYNNYKLSCVLRLELLFVRPIVFFSLLLFVVIRVGSLCKMSRFFDSHSLNASWGEKWHGNNRIRNLEKNCSIAVMFNAIKPGDIIHYDRIEHAIEWWLQDVSPSIDFSIGPCSLPRTRWQNYCSFISE